MGKILKRILLIKWHYIDYEILEMNRFINFFTGHSGAGKSTIIDAIQILLLGDTRGEYFFNKAAKDYANRTLVEYLMGRRQDGSYIRGEKNFTSYVVMEFYDENKGKHFCIGIVCGVDVVAKKQEHKFFYLDKMLPEHKFIIDEKPISYSIFKDQYKREATIFPTDKDYRTSFLIQYMGKLNPNFFNIFKKSISFNMDADIKDFIKNFICDDKTIDVEEMQENIRSYKALENTIAEVENEIEKLNDIENQYKIFQELKNKVKLHKYFIDKINEENSKLNIENLKEIINIDKEQRINLNSKFETSEEDLKKLNEESKKLEIKIINLQENKIIKDCESHIELSNEKIELYNVYKQEYNVEIARLTNWDKIENILPFEFRNIKNKIIEKNVEEDELKELEKIQNEVREELLNQHTRYKNQIDALDEKIKLIAKDIEEQKKGQKIHNTKLLEIREALEIEISRRYNKKVTIDILADVIEINDEKWRNAIEGYMASAKFNFLIAPEYYETAINIYEELKIEQKHRAAIVDIEKIMESYRSKERKNLATLIDTNNVYAQAYINYLLSNVVMCDSVVETRKHKIGITQTCMLYRGYILRALNERDYTKNVAIGSNSRKIKIRQLEEELNEVNNKKIQLINMWNDDPCSNYKLLNIIYSNNIANHINSIPKLEKEEKEKRYYEEILQNLDLTSLQKYENELKEKNELITKVESIKKQLNDSLIDVNSKISTNVEKLKTEQEEYSKYIKKIEEYSSDWIEENNALGEYLDTIKNEYKNKRVTEVILKINNRNEKLNDQIEEEKNKLYELRDNYNAIVQHRFHVYSEDNDPFNKRKLQLEQDALPEYKEKVKIQKEKAIIQFRDDFIYKMQDSIEEAKNQFDELNRSIEEIVFGRDKYRFKVTNSKNLEYKKFYDMFTNREIISMPNSLFSDVFAERYNDRIEELFEKIIYTDDDLTQKEKQKLEENIRIYSDYRTYLDFEMISILEDGTEVELSEALSKNSGGEGQNPLYIVLLSAFVRLYRIHQESKEKNHTLRLVVFDEAFNQMDAEKVKISLELIRQLKLQAIVVAPNDKMQNYIDSSEKTFIFNNINNKNIEIAPFEREEVLEHFKL